LAAHAIIIGPQGVGEWTFRKGGTTASVRLEGRLRITVLQGAYLAAVEGMGIVLTTLPALRREFESGTPEWDLGSVDVHASVYEWQSRKTLSAGNRSLPRGHSAERLMQ